MAGCAADDVAIGTTDKPGQTQPIDETAVSQGHIRVKFVSGKEPSGAVDTRSGEVSSGNEDLDRTLTSLGVTGLKRVFPHAGRFEERTRREGLHLWYDIYFDKSITATRATYDMTSLLGVEIAEAVFNVKHIDTGRAVAWTGDMESASPAALPFNDPKLAAQWHYQNDGSLKDAIAGADINLFRAWKIASGSNEVVVAVVDGGIDYAHEDLAGNVGNFAEINGLPGVDDDNNGYVDDLYGWNFMYSTVTGYSGTNAIEPEMHGTHVAGTIGAENNNGTGVCGVAGGSGGHTGVRLISCQIFTNDSDDGDELQALKYSADAGAVISQNSWGYTNASYMPQSTKSAVDYFIKYAGQDEHGNQVGPMKGGIVIFAAGNEYRDYLTYPAAYEDIVAVSAIAPDYKKSWYSNFSSWIDIAAPGGTYARSGRYSDECAVLSTWPGNRYGYYQGTSMACPHVSGIAALILSKYGAPGFTPENLKAHLYKGTKDVVYAYNPDYKDRLGLGLADAYMALSDDQGIAPSPVTDLAYSDANINVGLSWTVPADEDDGKASSFLILWRPDGFEGFDFSSLPEGTPSDVVRVVSQQVGDEMNYTLTELAETTAYGVAIIAIDAWGNRSAPCVTSFTTSANLPPVISREGSQEAVRLGYTELCQVIFLVTDPDGHDFTFVANDPTGVADIQKDGQRLQMSIHNYRCSPGTHTVRLTVSDKYGASASADVEVTLLPNEAPRIIAFEPAYFTSFEQSHTFDPALGFTDEMPLGMTYFVEYDSAALYVQRRAQKYMVMPLRYGLAEIVVTATDEEGLTSKNTFTAMCRDASREVDLYPNPVRTTLNIRMGQEVDGSVSVTVYDTNGSAVYSGNTMIGPFAPAAVDLSGLRSGSYTVTIEYEGRKISQSIVKS